MKGLAPLVERYELFQEVRGKGLMIGLVFGEPSSLRLKSRWKMMEGARKGLFSQLIVGPLFHRHRILTQVAGDNMNVVKLLPPLIAGQEEVDYFVEALDDVLADAHRNSALVVRVRQDARQERAAPGAVLSTLPGRRRTIRTRRSRSSRATAYSSRAQVGSSARRSPGPCSPGGPRSSASSSPVCADTNLDDLAVERVVADLRDGPAVLGRDQGCRLVFHVAALYRFWARDPAEFYEVNVGGSLNVVDAAMAAGVERLVYTSTVGTIGLDGTEQATARGRDRRGRGSIISSGSTSSPSTSPSTRCYVQRRRALPVVLVQPTLAARSGRPGAHADRQDGPRLPERAHPGLVRHRAQRRRRGRRRRGPPARGRAGAPGPQLRARRREPRAARRSSTSSPRQRACHGPRSRVPRRVALAAAHVSHLVEGRLLRREPSSSARRAHAWRRPA